jgi:para-nitrobenzyl esterase
MNTEVVTNYGKITGLELDECIVYKGIPYAKPPVGKLRWCAPQEPEKWDDVYRADTFSAKCPQSENYYGYFKKEFYENEEFLRGANEDCLYLNIWVPKTIDQNKPVAFWIHGGGFGGGYSSELEFDGEEYCKRGVILVTINYRVNVFGFLAHPWLSAENEKGISGNYGILDQIAALKWVSDNISNFGGNPENITVFGQSAGCMSTQVLTSSELTKDMIQKAVLQSGAVFHTQKLFMPTMHQAEQIGLEYVEYTGATKLEELRAMTPEELLAVNEKFEAEMWKRGNGIVLVPNVDGYVLKDTVANLLKVGDVKNIPYMIGTVTKELWVTDEELMSGNKGDLYADSKAWGEQMEKLGRKPAFIYYFSHPLPGDEEGAFHSAELWYMFGTLKRCWRPMQEADCKLSDEMLDYWTNFMKTGEPSAENTSSWRPYTGTNPNIKEFD